MTAHLSRRTLLGAVPTLAAPMALLPASIAEAFTETPILHLYGQWAPLRAAMLEPSASDEDVAPLYPPLLSLERRIEPLPVTCLEDLAAKVSALAVDETEHGATIPASVVAEARALLDDAASTLIVPPPVDPLPELVDAYFAAQTAWEAATHEPDGAYFNNPACLAAQAELDRLRPLIEGTTATSADGIIAQLAYIEEDFAGGHSEINGPTVGDVPVALLHRIAVAVERLQ